MKMESQNLTKKLEVYPIGTILNITWDRGNGELSADYIYLGSEHERPNLKRYEKGKDLTSYKDDVSFDIYNPDLNIINMNVITHK